jgi:hypothetical protein
MLVIRVPLPTPAATEAHLIGLAAVALQMWIHQLQVAFEHVQVTGGPCICSIFAA